MLDNRHHLVTLGIKLLGTANFILRYRTEYLEDPIIRLPVVSRVLKVHEFAVFALLDVNLIPNTI